MAEKVEFKQLGEKLKEARENKHISLEAISEKTKINPGFLKNFENGEFNFLPEFYIRHFLRSYLNCLGKSAMHLFKEFEQLKKRQEQAEQNEEEIKEAEKTPKISQIFEIIGKKRLSAFKFH